MYSALTVARYVVDSCYQKGLGVSNLKLQKILYFIQAEFLVSKPGHMPCFADRIEAWDFGPVVPNVYHRYKIYGGAIIVPMQDDPMAAFYEDIRPEDKARIDGILQETERFTASELVQITHGQSPWLDVYSPGMNNEITQESILNFFGG